MRLYTYSVSQRTSAAHAPFIARTLGKTFEAMAHRPLSRKELTHFENALRSRRLVEAVMTNWSAFVTTLIPQGQLAEVLTIVRDDENGAPLVMDSINWSKPGEFGGVPIPSGQPLFSEGYGCVSKPSEIDKFLQCVLDLAWDRGLRPKNFSLPDELAAVRAHLVDMQQLVFLNATAECVAKMPEHVASSLDETVGYISRPGFPPTRPE